MADYYTLVDFTLPFYEIHGQTQKMHDDCIVADAILSCAFEASCDEDTEVNDGFMDDLKKAYDELVGPGASAKVPQRLFDIVAKHYVKLEGDEREVLSVDIRVESTNGGVRFSTDENADPAQVVHLAQMFAEVCGMNGVWGFEYSNTCSKPRSDAYGGGAVVFTRTSETWMNTYHWMTKEIDKINARRLKKAKKK